DVRVQPPHGPRLAADAGRPRPRREALRRARSRPRPRAHAGRPPADGRRDGLAALARRTLAPLHRARSPPARGRHGPRRELRRARPGHAPEGARVRSCARERARRDRTPLAWGSLVPWGSAPPRALRAGPPRLRSPRDRALRLRRTARFARGGRAASG